MDELSSPREELLRRAYERGRWRRGFRSGLPFALLLFVGLSAGGLSTPVATVGALTMWGLLASAEWWSAGAGGGARAGALLTVGPAASALFMSLFADGLDPATCAKACGTFALGGGLVVGFALARRVAALSDSATRATAIGAAVATASFAVGLGCVATGLGGLGGLAMGATIGAVPGLLIPPRTA